MELNDSQTIKLQINTNSYACKFEYKNNINLYWLSKNDLTKVYILI